MAFTIDFLPVPLADIISLQFQDKSTGDETVQSRVITIIKPDLSSNDYNFTNPNDPTQTSITVNGILDKDYALEATFTVVTNADTYTKSYKFVTLGYAQKARVARVKRLKIDNTIEQKDQYAKDTLDIAYNMVSANDLIASGDIQGAQQGLDYIAEVVQKDSTSQFSY